MIRSDGLIDIVEKKDITNALASEGKNAAKKLLEQVIVNGAGQYYFNYRKSNATDIDVF